MAVGPTLYIRVSNKSAGHAQYQFGPDADMSLVALRVTMDTTGAGATRTIYVSHSAQNGDILYDQYVAVEVDTGMSGRFSLAPEANPCDSFTDTTFTAVADTFPALVFSEGDYLDVYAVDATDGTVQTDSPLTSVRLLVSDFSGAAAPGLQPLLVPIPLGQQFAGAFGG